MIDSQCVRTQSAVGSTTPRQVDLDCERKGTNGGSRAQVSQQRSQSAAFLGGSCFMASVASAAVHHLKHTLSSPRCFWSEDLIAATERHQNTHRHCKLFEGLLFIPACMPHDEASPPSLSPLALADPSAARSVSPAAEKPGHSLSSLKSRHPYSLGSRHVRLKPLNNPSPYVSI